MADLLKEARMIYPAYSKLIDQFYKSLDSSEQSELMIQQMIDFEERIEDLDQRIAVQQKVLGRVNKLKQQLFEQTERVKEYNLKVFEARANLEAALKDAEEQRAISKNARKKGIDHSTLLLYAQRVSKHTLSPINAKCWAIEPPIPQDNHMRMSLLFQQDELFETVKEDNVEYKLDDHHMEIDLSDTKSSVKAEDISLDMDFL